MSEKDKVPIEHRLYCAWCGWSGNEGKAIDKPDPLHPDEVITDVGCPNCGSDEWLTVKEVG